jgi:hypothetical protein
MENRENARLGHKNSDFERKRLYFCHVVRTGIARPQYKVQQTLTKLDFLVKSKLIETAPTQYFLLHDFDLDGKQ